MEVCPYCKKSFKRLKSHLPHCKSLRPTTPADQNVSQSQLPPHTHAHGRKRPVRDVTEAKQNSLERETEGRNTKVIRDEPKGTAEFFPPVGVEKASYLKAGHSIKTQTQLSPKLIENSGTQMTFQGVTVAQSSASVDTSKRKRFRGVPESGHSRSHPSETDATLLLAPRERSSSNQDRKHSSALPEDRQVPSAHLKLDRRNVPRQEFLMKSLDTPIDYHPLTRYSDGVATVQASLSSSERDPKPRGPLSAVPAYIRNSETEEKNPKSIISGLRGSPAGTVQVEEVMIGMKKTALLHHLVAEAHGNAEKSLPVGKMPLKIQGSKSYSAADSATGRNFESTRPSPGQTAPSESLSVSQPYHPSLPSLALKTLQEEKADARSQSRVAGLQTLLNGEERAAPEPRSVPHCQASHTGHLRPLSAAWYHPAQTPFSPVHAADRRACPSSVGLEWFPELYPGYLGLGVLPRKPQYWDAVVSKPQLINPPGEELSQVLLLERSPTDGRILEPLTRLVTSSVSLMRLLGALQQGWTRCSSLARRSRGGSIAMLFTGYFVLCCSWSVRRLRLQRWRKQC